MLCSHKKSHTEYHSCSKKNRRDASSSSSSDDSLYDNINKLSNHIHEVEKRLDRIKNKETKFNYTHLIKSLLCDNQIQFGGSMAYGTFFSQLPQIVLPHKPFLFEYKTVMKNFHFEHNTHHLRILLSGVYTVNLIIQVDQPSQIALFVNNIPLLKTITSTNTNSKVLSLSYTVALKKHDKLEVRNFNQTNAITTSLPEISTTLPSQNFQLMLNRISVLCNDEYKYKCVNKKSDSDCEYESDTESESSNSESCSESNSESCSESDTDSTATPCNSKHTPLPTP
jgi:hypothetical protein